MTDRPFEERLKEVINCLRALEEDTDPILDREKRMARHILQILRGETTLERLTQEMEREIEEWKEQHPFLAWLNRILR